MKDSQCLHFLNKEIKKIIKEQIRSKLNKKQGHKHGTNIFFFPNGIPKMSLRSEFHPKLMRISLQEIISLCFDVTISAEISSYGERLLR